MGSVSRHSWYLISDKGNVDITDGLDLKSPYQDLDDLTNNPTAENPSLKALHLNIHSLLDKIDQLKLLMDKLLNSNRTLEFVLLYS